MHKLDDLKYITSLDKSDMYSKIMSLPDQIHKAYFEPNVHYPDEKSNGGEVKPNSIIFCGMGGSAISADIAKVLYGKYIHVSVVKDYHLPYVDEHTLVIVLSYSGNTEETISCLNQAITKTRHIIAITSGGKIRQMVDGKYLWLELVGGYPPRSAIGFLLCSLIKALEIYDIIPSEKDGALSSIKWLNNAKANFGVEIPTDKNDIKRYAGDIFNYIPIIYSDSPKYAPIAYRWKCQINENAKYPAFNSTLPEMLHNEVEGWEHSDLSSKFVPVCIMEGDNISKGLKPFQELLDEWELRSYEANAFEGNVLAVMIGLIFYGDLLSYYLAILNEVDPTDIGYIDYIKQNS